MTTDVKTPATSPLPSPVRVWLYIILHTTISPLKSLDCQLALEVALDKIAAHALPDTILEYPLSKMWPTWQDQARNGGTLHDILSGWVPSAERDVFENATHETLEDMFGQAIVHANAKVAEAPSVPPPPPAPAQPWYQSIPLGTALLALGAGACAVSVFL